MKLILTVTKPVLVFMLSVFTLFSYSQGWQWAKGEGDIGNEAANSVAFDDFGNVYITGNIAGMINFGGTVYQGRGIYEVLIAKYSAQGSLVWVKTAGGKENDQGTFIRYNKNYIYVTGYFSDTAWFDNKMLVSRGDQDVFLAKYDLIGNLMWVRQAGGANFDYGTSVDVDNTGNVYVTGGYEYDIWFGSAQLTTSNVYNESFFAKYDNAGNLLWAKTTAGNGSNLITGVAFDYRNSVYLTGYFGSNFNIGNCSVNSATPSYDVFLSKVDSGGNCVWLKRAGSTNEDASHGVCSDKEGNPSIAGYFLGTAYFDNHSVTSLDYNDIFVAHYDSLGNNLWAVAGNGTQLDVPYGIAADATGNIYVTGMFEFGVNFNGSVITGPDRDIFLISFDRNGSVRWLAHAGGLNTDCGIGVAVSNTGKVAVAGYYLYTNFFGSIQIDYAVGNDLFVAVYDPLFVGINEIDDLQVFLYPNPCQDIINCQLPVKSLENTWLRIYTSFGEKIYDCKISDNWQMATNNWQVGIYFAEFLSGDKRRTIKLLKQ